MQPLECAASPPLHPTALTARAAGSAAAELAWNAPGFADDIGSLRYDVQLAEEAEQATAGLIRSATAVPATRIHGNGYAYPQGCGALSGEWRDAPHSVGLAPATAERRVNAHTHLARARTWSHPHTQVVFTVRGLRARVSYRFRVRASNAHGCVPTTPTNAC